MIEPCKRSDGTNRAFFETAEDAVTFRSQHPTTYGEDEVRFCTRCGHFHLSHPTWVKSWETLIENVVVN